jgi:ABC-2 type transport system ATP-binding protein
VPFPHAKNNDYSWRVQKVSAPTTTAEFSCTPPVTVGKVAADKTTPLCHDDVMQPILEVRHLRKRYSSIEAVRDVSFSVPAGICFGLLGPNGAGKTTTLEIIEDIIPATSGDVLYRGKSRNRTFREEIGIQFQHTSLFNFLSVRETLETFAGLYSNPADCREISRRCGLDAIENQRNDKLSGGQAQRLMLALALINQPHLVFLDEPSTGLDPQSRRNLWGIIRELKDEGRTLILTTHSMEEAEYLCDDIAIMDQGTIIASGSPGTLIERHGGGSSIILPGHIPQETLQGLEYTLQNNGAEILVHTDTVHQGLKELIDRNIDLPGISVHSANLEDVFLRLTGKKLRE